MKWLALIACLFIANAQAQYPTGAPYAIYSPAVSTPPPPVPATQVTFTGIGPCSGTSTATSGGTSGSISCPANGVTIAAGTTVANVTVLPSNWTGTVAITGGTGSYTGTSFVIAGSGPTYTVNVGSNPLVPDGTGLSGAFQGAASP